MGGRESRGGPGSHRAAVRSRIRRDGPGGAVHEVEGRGSSGRGGPTWRSPLYSRPFVQWIGRGGADHGEGEQVGNRARSASPSPAETAGKRHGPCTPVDSFSRGGPGGAVRGVGGERRGREEPVRETIGRGGSRGSRRRVLVTIEVQTLGPCRTREEPTGSGDDGEVRGNHRETGEVREEATPPSEPQTS